MHWDFKMTRHIRNMHKIPGNCGNITKTPRKQLNITGDALQIVRNLWDLSDDMHNITSNISDITRDFRNSWGFPRLLGISEITGDLSN